MVARPALPIPVTSVEVFQERYTAPWKMFPTYRASISLPDSDVAATWARTVGARAVNHFASLEISMELLQPVPEAIGELLEYTALLLYQRLACFTETLGRSQSGSFPSSSASSLLTEDLARDPAESVFAWLFN